MLVTQSTSVNKNKYLVHLSFQFKILSDFQLTNDSESSRRNNLAVPPWYSRAWDRPGLAMDTFYRCSR